MEQRKKTEATMNHTTCIPSSHSFIYL